MPGYSWFIPTSIGLTDAEFGAVVANEAAPATVERVQEVVQASVRRLAEMEVVNARGGTCAWPS